MWRCVVELPIHNVTLVLFSSPSSLFFSALLSQLNLRHHKGDSPTHTHIHVLSRHVCTSHVHCKPISSLFTRAFHMRGFTHNPGVQCGGELPRLSCILHACVCVVGLHAPWVFFLSIPPLSFYFYFFIILFFFGLLLHIFLWFVALHGSFLFLSYLRCFVFFFFSSNFALIFFTRCLGWSELISILYLRFFSLLSFGDVGIWGRGRPFLGGSNGCIVGVGM